jgi:uncharacterized cupin superfamily protein
MKKILLFFAALFLTAGASFAQTGVRVGTGANPVISVTTPGGPLMSVPNATISFCNVPANGVPCTNKASTWTDSTLTTACPSSTQVVLDGSNVCVGSTDQYGNWGVWVASGQYAYTVTLPTGASTGPFFVTAGGSGGSGVNPAAPGLATQFSNAAVSGLQTISNGGVPFGYASTPSPGVYNVPVSNSVAGPRPALDATNPIYAGGAKGINTDDTAALQAVIAAACSTTIGGVSEAPDILLPPGFYGVQQVQTGTSATASPLNVPCAVHFRGAGGQLTQFGLVPMAILSVIPGASPNSAALISVTIDSTHPIGGVTFDGVDVEGYNRAVTYFNFTDVHATHSAFRAKVTGLTDNAPLQFVNGFGIYFDHNVIGFNTPNPALIGNLPDVQFLGETEASGDIVYLAHFTDNTLYGACYQYDQRAPSNGPVPTAFYFEFEGCEDSAQGYFNVISTTSNPSGIAQVIFTQALVEDPQGSAPFFNFNQAGGFAGGIQVNESGGSGNIAIQQTAGTLASGIISGCATTNCANVAQDAFGNPLPGIIMETQGGQDFVANVTSSAANQRLVTNFLQLQPMQIQNRGTAFRLFKNNSLYACAAGDAIGILFSDCASNGYTAQITQAVQETLDIGFSIFLPPTNVTVSATSGGTLPNGTYYYFVAPATSTVSCASAFIGSPSIISGAVTTTTGINQVVVGWTLPAAAPGALGGFCVFRGTQAGGYNSQTGIYVSGATTTTVTDTGSNFSVVGDFIFANHLQAFHRFFPYCLGINNTSCVYDLDVTHTTATNTGVRATALLLTGQASAGVQCAQFTTAGQLVGTGSACGSGGGGGTPGGSSGQFQWNNGGTFGGVPALTFDGTSTVHLVSTGILTLDPGAVVNGITPGMIPTLNQNTTGSAAKWTTARNLAGNSVDGSANVNFTNKFIVGGTSDSGLTGAQFLGALSTCILLNTTGAAPNLSCAIAANFPTLNQNTTGTAANLSGTPTVPNGTAATTQACSDTSTKLATDGYVAGCALINPASTTNQMLASTTGGALTAITGLTGQVPVFNTGGNVAAQSPGLQDGNGGSAVTTTPYPVACDSTTSILDRVHVLRLQSGASVVTNPLSTATGCAGGFTYTLFDDGAGSVTVNATSADTFSIFNGFSNVDGATSFSMTNGTYATLSQGASGIWEVRLAQVFPTQGAHTVLENATGSTAQPTAVSVPVSATLLGTNSSAAPIAAALTSANIFVGNGSNLPVGVAVSGDATLANTGAVSVVKVNGNTPGGSCTNQVVTSVSSSAVPTCSNVVGADMTANTVTATQLAAQYSKGSCTEAWGGSGTAHALSSGDDAVVNNTCYNDSGVTRTITAVKARSDAASNTTTVNPTFGSAGTGTTICSGALTAGSSLAYSSTCTVSNASWTTGTGINPVQGGTLTGTSVALIIEYTY